MKYNNFFDRVESEFFLLIDLFGGESSVHSL